MPVPPVVQQRVRVQAMTMSYGHLAIICIAPVVVFIIIVGVLVYRGRKGRRYD